MSIGRFLQDKRIQQSMTVEEVAEKSELSVPSIRAYEQGRRIPSAVSLRKVFSVFDVEESTWIDNITWKNPTDGTIYELAPKGGAWANSRRTNTYQESNLDRIAVLRINAIESILKADRKTLKAIILLLTK